MASSSQTEIERFRQSDVAPTGEWWAEFLVGVSLEEKESVDQPVNRRIDAICVTSRESSDVGRMYKDEHRDKRQAGWLDGEDVVLVEYGRGTAAWGKYGGLDVRRRLFEQDWKYTRVEAALLVMEISEPQGRADTRWIFENELTDYEYIVKYDGEFYPYRTFIQEYC